MDPGGAKKFLYSGAKKDAAAEEDQWTFLPKPQDSKSSLPVDLNDVWSIQKNVSLGGPGPMASHDRLTQNVNKGFYSRHGGMKDNGKTPKPPDKAEVGTAWAPARGSSFSYSSTAGHAGADDSSSFTSSHASRGYRSNPTQRRMDTQSRPLDENEF